MADTLQDQYQARQAESSGQLNNMFDKQYEAQAAGLKTEYEKSLSDQTAALKNLAPQYQSQANSLAAGYEKQRRNANLGAMTSGLGSGTGQQQQNAMSNAFTQNYGALRGAEAGAVNEGNQKLADIQTAYNNALVNARADVDAKRAQEEIKNFNTNRDWYEAQAQNLATNYGIFDPTANTYGQAQADQMRNVWISQNPEVAFRAGMISKDEYQKLTGKIPTLQYQSIYQ